MPCPLFRTALAVALANAFIATAQAADDAAVVVTATRTPTRASEILSDVSVITRDDIERSGQSTLAEVLQAQPGVQIWTNGGPGAVASVSIRGSSPQHTVVLLDGQRLSSATVGTTAFEHLPLNQVERIEILRGPASALYGADAIGGVIQIFTRKSTGAPRVAADFGVGSYRTDSGSVNYGGAVGDTNFNLDAGYLHSGGFSATKPGAYGFNPDRDGYDNRNFSARVAQRIASDHEIGADVFYSDGKTHYDAANCDPTFTVCTNAFDNHQTQTLSSYSVHARDRFLPHWTSQLRIGRSEDSMTSYSLDPLAGTVGGQSFRTVQDQFSWQNDIVTDAGKIMLATERRAERVDSNAVAFTVGERTTNSFLAGYQAWFGKHSLQVGARRDDISQFGAHSSGSFAYGYQLTSAWRASLATGTAYRAPTFDDLYWPVDFSTFYVGNPNLRPERARNREAGIVYEEGDRRVSLTHFENRVSDLITFGDAAAPAFFITTVNVGRAMLKGDTVAYSDAFGRWKTRIAYDALSARDMDTNLYLMRRAKQHGTAELRYDGGNWDAGAQLVATGPRFDDAANTRTMAGFGLVNIDGRHALGRDWSLVGRINNLFNRRYELVQGFNTPGANLFVGFRYLPK
ncbi:MAG: TonB-dependent receptor [Rhodocyclaceae bacterium]|nr:TonB-dependent receptor [Rhodocyclaceae bacterium]